MVKQFSFSKNPKKQKKRETKNYRLLKEKGVAQQFVKIYGQNQEETKQLYEELNPCIIMEAGQISLDKFFTG